jgi:hypothetical protein
MLNCKKTEGDLLESFQFRWRLFWMQRKSGERKIRYFSFLAKFFVLCLFEFQAFAATLSFSLFALFSGSFYFLVGFLPPGKCHYGN